MGIIDLRSDTVTRPTAAMRKAMAEAEVGDDVYGEDPTVRRLEEEAAALLGFESAIFVPSGMMGNQIGLRLLVPRGSELLVDARAHVVQFEQGALASIGGIQTRTLETADGWPTVEALEAAFHPPSAYGVATGGLALENTHNLAGGRVLPPERGRLLLEWARKRGIPVHLDGARLWNAAVALDLPPASLAQGFDTVMVCLSKGLAAPVGSLLVSSCERIREARRLRRELGGGMRQAGVLAAAGLVALREGMSWLAADHRRARRLAEALANLQGIEIDPTAVETNIGIFRVQLPGRNSAQELVSAFAARGVWMAALDGSCVRFVTHRDIDDRALEQAIRIVTEVVHEVTNASRGFSR